MTRRGDEAAPNTKGHSMSKTKTEQHPTQNADIWLDKGAVSRDLTAVRASSLFGAFKVGLLGTQPVIVHRFDEKSAKQIEDKQAGAVKKKKLPPRDREAEVASAAYMLEGKFGEEGARYGVPTAGFKHALVSTARHLDGVNMTQLRQQCFVMPDTGRLTEIWFDRMEANTDAVRIGGMSKTTTLRYRPYFYGWRCLLTIRYWKDVIQPQQILQCLELGGTIDGYGEWRPGKSNSGWAGTWVTISEDEFDQIQSGAVSTEEMVSRIQREEMAA